MVYDTVIVKAEYNPCLLHFFSFELDGKSLMNIQYLFEMPRICHITRGSADWDISGKVYKVESGDMVILNGTVLRKFTKVYPPYDFSADIYEFSPAILSTNLKLLGIFYSYSNCIIKFPNSYPIVNELENVKKELFSDKEMREDIIKSRLITALILINRAFKESENGNNEAMEMYNTSTSFLIYDTAVYIWNNITKPLNTSLLAKRVNMSRGYFCTVFKKFNNTTPADYIKMCRVTHAMQLIHTKNNTIMQSALDSGFNSASSFYKAFRDITGMTPREYFNEKNSCE